MKNFLDCSCLVLYLICVELFLFLVNLSWSCCLGLGYTSLVESFGYRGKVKSLVSELPDWGPVAIHAE